MACPDKIVVVGFAGIPIGLMVTPIHLMEVRALGYRAQFTDAPAVATETSAAVTESSTGRQRRHGERSRP